MQSAPEPPTYATSAIIELPAIVSAAVSLPSLLDSPKVDSHPSLQPLAVSEIKIESAVETALHAEVARLTALLHAPAPSTESAAIIDDLCAAIAPTTESIDSPAAAPTPEPNASSAESKPGPNTPEAPAAAPAVEPERTESPLAQLPFRDRVNAFLPVAGGVALVLSRYLPSVLSPSLQAVRFCHRFSFPASYLLAAPTPSL